MPVVAEPGPFSTDCPRSTDLAVAELGTSLLAMAALPLPCARELELADLDHSPTFVPEPANELDPATLKWSGSGGRKGEG
jgi:hypothetical protein